MKKMLLTCLVVVMSIYAYAQTDAISRYFGEYEGKEDFTTIIITSRMFGLLADIPENEDEEDMMNIIRKLTGLKLIIAQDSSDGEMLYRKALTVLPKNGYDELMIIKEGDEEIKFLIQEKGGKISEFIMLIGGGESDFLIMSMVGDLDLKDIRRLSKTMDIEGFEHLEKVDDSEN